MTFGELLRCSCGLRALRIGAAFYTKHRSGNDCAEVAFFCGTIIRVYLNRRAYIEYASGSVERPFTVEAARTERCYERELGRLRDEFARRQA